MGVFRRIRRNRWNLIMLGSVLWFVIVAIWCAVNDEHVSRAEEFTVLAAGVIPFFVVWILHMRRRRDYF